MEPIFTLDARDHVLLETIKSYFGLSNTQVLKEIQLMHQQLIQLLKRKGIKYSDLKTALTPSLGKNETALVFDTQKIEDSWYGLPVFNKFFPLLNKESNHSIKCGDICDSGNNQEWIYNQFCKYINLNRSIEYGHSTQFYLIYINNLSNMMVNELIQGLGHYDAYVGYFDFTHDSPFKNHISSILVDLCLKNKKNILLPHEDDRDDDEDINLGGYPYESLGYKSVSFRSDLFGLLLSYKIERQVYPGFESDAMFAMNALTESIIPLTDLTIEISEDKLNYLKTAKKGKLKKAGIEGINKQQLISLIKHKLTSNYFYHLEFLNQHNVIKFNLMIEVKNKKYQKPTKLINVFEYMPKKKVLRLISLY